MRKPAKLTAAIQWIALNDNVDDDEDVATTAGYLTVALVADVFGLSTDEVAARVVDYRRVYFNS